MMHFLTLLNVGIAATLVAAVPGASNAVNKAERARSQTCINYPGGTLVPGVVDSWTPVCFHPPNPTTANSSSTTVTKIHTHSHLIPTISVPAPPIGTPEVGPFYTKLCITLSGRAPVPTPGSWPPVCSNVPHPPRPVESSSTVSTSEQVVPWTTDHIVNTLITITFAKPSTTTTKT
ncbi:hypothetical protein K504DRAFT_510269 [Pleomassaria siparia CBS 279.74]|uniref:Lytic polysaccharide monooxygenase n=1 Tax=Pleomassaria siparia CBS 279.74 TaxID=1314801 RepID=A0A6G1KQL7_9PLEO|nr:hypothetical protein K504DRAFT_510269 [Pleomassaria siparia CBS 279.74]